MKTGQLKDYAPQARRDFIAAVTDRAAFYGLTADEIVEVQEKGDVAIIAGRPFPRSVAVKRKKLEEQIRQHGFDQVMEKVAYTWFNRLVAIRFMELHGYLDHGYRVLSHPQGKPLPEIVEHAEHVQLPGLDQATVIELKLDGNKESELYRLLLVAQCNALSRAMPFLFESIDDETELLLPDNLLHSDSLIRTLVESIDEEDWKEGIEIVGWLYQFYVSMRRGGLTNTRRNDLSQTRTSQQTLSFSRPTGSSSTWSKTAWGDNGWPPTRTRRSRPRWNTTSSLPSRRPRSSPTSSQITPTSLNPEELTLFDPACGSGHILVEAYDILKAIYQERGYRAKDIPRLILEKNLFGLEINDRAAQLAAFALIMKARADDRRIFDSGVQPHVLAIQDSKGLDAKEITDALNAPILNEKAPPSTHLFEEIADEETPLFSRKNLSVKGVVSQAEIAHLIQLFEHGKTFGSLIRIPEKLTEKLPAIIRRTKEVLQNGGLFEQAVVRSISQVIAAASLLASRYDVVSMNPPYLGGKAMPLGLKEFAFAEYPENKSDLFAMFIERAIGLATPNGHVSMVTMHNWMFLVLLRATSHRFDKTAYPGVNDSSWTKSLQFTFRRGRPSHCLLPCLSTRSLLRTNLLQIGRRGRRGQTQSLTSETQSVCLLESGRLHENPRLATCLLGNRRHRAVFRSRHTSFKGWRCSARHGDDG